VSVSFRRARADDVEFLVALVNDDEVEPFLSARAPKDREGVLAQVERSVREPDAYGRLVIEVDGERAGGMGYELVNERNRIAHLGGLAVHPRFRGRRVADEAAQQLKRHLLLELGFHRLELEVYGFNERALAHADRVGFTREGVKRKAYWRHGEWVDGVLFGLVAEDLEPAAAGLRPPTPSLADGDIRLVPLTLAHAEELELLAQDPDVARYTRVSPPFSRAQAEAWAGRYVSGWRDGSLAGFAVETADGAFAGFAGVVRYDAETREAELGYIVAPAHRGRGVAGRALGLLARWAIRDAGVLRLELRIEPANAASIAVAERASFRRDGVLRSLGFNDRRADLAVYSLLAEELP
jgi:RimJ/RimL family protein N-acetyltransferase